MNSITAENRECWHSRNQSTKGIPPQNPPKRTPGTGYYLALTFGTLLSSQGTDAQQLHPHGLHRQRLVHLTPSAGPATPGGAGRCPRGRVRRIDQVRTGGRSCQTTTS